MLRFWTLKGSTSYAQVWELQKKLVELRQKGVISDIVLFVEHDPVITRGSGLQDSAQKDQKRVPLSSPLPEGIEYCEVERGGDLTYHGPGQLVVYPIVRLDGRGFGPNKDIHDFLRRLESILIDELDDLEIEGSVRKDATGVWVGDRKIASIGIAVKKWVTFHGLALNVTNDLKPFFHISPCGFSPEVMTRLSDLYPDLCHQWGGNWRPWLEGRIAQRFVRHAELQETPKIQKMTLEEALSSVRSKEILNAELSP